MSASKHAEPLKAHQTHVWSTQGGNKLICTNYFKFTQWYAPTRHYIKSTRNEPTSHNTKSTRINESTSHNTKSTRNNEPTEHIRRSARNNNESTRHNRGSKDYRGNITETHSHLTSSTYNSRWRKYILSNKCCRLFGPPGARYVGQITEINGSFVSKCCMMTRIL